LYVELNHQCDKLNVVVRETWESHCNPLKNLDHLSLTLDFQRNSMRLP